MAAVTICSDFGAQKNKVMGSQDFSEVIWERFLRGEEKFNQLFKGCFLLDLA